MVDQTSELRAAQDHIEQLVQAIVAIGSDLDLHGTLQRIVKASMELTAARIGALGILRAEGGFGSFIHAGLDADAACLFADLPVGDGLRVDDIAADPRASEWDLGALSVRTLLAIPITVRGAEFGNLYLADDQPGHAFSDFEDRAVRALASASAVAIDNARLFERERETAKWTTASREITTALLSGDPQTGPLQLIVNRALELAGAEQAILLVPRESDVPVAEIDTLVVAAAAGRYTSEVIGQQVPMDRSTTGGVARSGIPLITDSFQYPIEGFTDVGERPAIVIPLMADEAVLGVIAVARNPQQPAFGPDYLELVSDFARHAAIALALAAGREHALNRQLSEADTVDDALRGATEELRRLWRARRVLAVTFPSQRQASEHSAGYVDMVSVGEPTRWDDLPDQLRRTLASLRDGDLLRPYTAEPGTAGIALQHPEGVLVVWIDLAEQRPFTLEDQTLLTMQAGRLGQGLQRVHQFDQQRETALALQHAILGPAHLPQGFAVRYEAASRPLQVGGDWYDIVDLEDGRIGLIVGDCVGHGLAAATVMGQLRSACRALLLERPSPRLALAGLDRFAARLPGALCTTAVCAVLHRESGELVYSIAGHPPPIVMHADGTTQILEDGRTIPLGMRPDRARPDARIVLPARSVLLFYTDGLVERRGRSLDDGIDRVCSLLHDGRDGDLEQLANQIMHGLAPSGGYQDDVALLMYRNPGPLEIEFPADPNLLAGVRGALRDWLRRAALDADQIDAVLVAAGEAVSNAIEHGHRDTPAGSITLRANVTAAELILTITDTGSWKPPLQATKSYRGRGIALMRALMQDVRIDPEADGTTVHLTASIV
ncbi:SpoIIE family protein phosphatase [Mycobacterium sp.]|uniref:SpoIIE family protein phosphatase n=1 Tax=Mycobacterium sp. TaxID=1785 RepID=UPI0025F89107|nr:SpoIIE family protein phosphatase [Mycobacterium sp.]